jgi:type IV pilus assembly protein PilC
MSQTYTFQGADQRGTLRRGRIVAIDRTTAEIKLHRRGITVSRLQRRRVADLVAGDWSLVRARLPLREVAWVARNIAGLLDSGLTIAHACELLADQRPGKRVGRVMSLIHADLEDGYDVDEAFARQQRQLGRATVAMVRAGAASGSMAPTFAGIAALHEMQLRLRTNLRRATVYPAVVVALVLAILIMMITLVVPRFQAIYADLGADLPRATRIVLGVSEVISRQAWAIPALILLSISLIAVMRQIPTGRLLTDRAVLALPRLGAIVRRSLTARAAGMMGALLRSGVPMLDALELSGQATANSVFERAFAVIRDEIALGQPVSVSFAGADELPLVLRDLTAVGDASGDLPGVLTRYATEVEQDLKRDGEGFAKALEPVLIVAAGVLIGAIVIAMYLPLFSLIDIID